MNEFVLLGATGVWPLLLAVIVALAPTRRFGLRLVVLAPLPALVLALAGQTVGVGRIRWLLLDTHVGLDETGLVFLLLAASLWTFACLYARGYMRHDRHPHRFYVFFLLTMAGSLMLSVAHDVVLFYAAFALMTFAAYGFIVHDLRPASLRAGRVYMVLAVLGEVMLLVGLLLGAFMAQSLRFVDVAGALSGPSVPVVAMGLVASGFALKVGVVPLHVWLPLAHPVAPTPGSAVLSGLLIKGGLLGWLRILPFGDASALAWGEVFLVAGFVMMFYGVLVGLTQGDAKTVLAYSSISQMGFMTVLVGVGLQVPTMAGVAVTAALVYALHHGLAKGGLFLGVGVARDPSASRGKWRVFAVLGLALGALSLAGAPLTSGAVAKYALKEVAASLGGAWTGWAGFLLVAGAVGTTVLMLRFALCMRKEWGTGAPHARQGAVHAGSDPGKHADPDKIVVSLWGSWFVVILLGGLFAWWVPPRYLGVAPGPASLALGALWSAIYPMVIGLLVGGSLWWGARRSGLGLPRVPSGDLVVLLEGAGDHVQAGWQRLAPWLRGVARVHLLPARLRDWADPHRLDRVEFRFKDWGLMGLLLLVLVVVMVALQAWGVPSW